MKKLFVLSFLLVFALVLVPSSAALAANAAGNCGIEIVGSLCGGDANKQVTDTTRYCYNSTLYSTEAACLAAKNSATATGSGLEIPFVKEGLRGIQTTGGPDSIEGVAVFIAKIGNYLFTFLMAAAVILIIWGAFDFIAGGGDPKRIEAARAKIMWAFVGIAIALLAVFFAPIVRSFLGVSK